MLPLLITACVPKTIAPAVPEPAGPPAAEVRVAFPVEARPAEERRGGGFHVPQVPMPQVGWGDLNLRPGALELVDRTVRSAASSSTGPLEIEVWVLHHSGRRDRSDASWVSTATGGVAGMVGQAVYPEFLLAEARLRVRIRTPDAVVVRDVGAVAVRRRAVFRTWALWSLYRRSFLGEMMEDAFEDVHRQLHDQLREVVAQIEAGAPVTAGLPPDVPAQASLIDAWNRADTLQAATARSPLLVAKYPSPTFSVVSGHTIQRGETIGRIGVPVATLGYDVGLSDHSQLLLDVTVLGIYNAASAGLRWQPAGQGDTRIALEGRFGGQILLDTTPWTRAVLAGTNGGLAVVVSRPSGPFTAFVRLGARAAFVRQTSPHLPDLGEGRVLGVFGGPGIEGMLSPTVALSAQLAFRSEIQDGRFLSLGLGPVLPLPQVTLGFR